MQSPQTNGLKKITMNIAQSFLAYYESEDFKKDYGQSLSESFSENESTIIDQIINLFNVQNYEVERDLSNYKVITREQGKQIYDFIEDNLEEFLTDFNGYYVGYTSLFSVSYGEQEEQLDGIYNVKTKDNYTLKYLKKICDSEGFVINGDYAYYNLDGGLHIDLLNNVEILNNFLLTLI